MPKLIVMITPMKEEARSVAEGWQQMGAPGVTFIESYGIRQLKTASPAAEALSDMITMGALDDQHQSGVTLLCLVRDVAMAEKLIEVVQQRIGNLNGPQNGVLFVLDVERALGLRPYMG